MISFYKLSELLVTLVSTLTQFPTNYPKESLRAAVGPWVERQAVHFEFWNHSRVYLEDLIFFVCIDRIFL